MRYTMPNPTLINGRYYLRLHVPNDITSKAQGQKLHIPVGDQKCAVTMGKVMKVSLQTSNYDEANPKLSGTKHNVFGIQTGVKQCCSKPPLHSTSRGSSPHVPVVPSVAD